MTLALSAIVAIAVIAIVAVSRSDGGADAYAQFASAAPNPGPRQSASNGLEASPTPTVSKPASSASAAPTRSATATQPADRAGWPSAANTGVPSGHRLRSSGAMRVTTPGAVLDGLEVHGDISVEANNVTIKNSRIVNEGTWGIIQRQNASGLTVTDSEIRGNGKDQLQHAIFNLGGMVTIRRTDMSIVSDAISTSVGLIVDNYLHDPKYFPGDHLDMIQSNSGPNSGQQLVIRHNTIVNTYEQTSAIALFQDFGIQHDALIENNLLAGGGYALYAGAGTKGKSSNIRVVNNVFSRQVFPDGGRFGPVAYWDEDGSGNVWQSNVWAETGAPVTP
jgi:hypothetical protein